MHPFSKRTIAILLTVLSFASTTEAASWWNHDWSIRKKITVDTAAAGAAITEPIGTAAVLIRLHDGNFQFSFAKEDASDLRFVAADDKTPLSFHLERFDPLLNEAFVWVKVPDIKPGAQTSFWLYYGNTAPSAVRIDDAKSTYDGDAVLVYHFSERGQPASDSTATGNTALNAGGVVDGALIAGGSRLDGRSAVTIPSSPSLAWASGGALTWSAWIKPSLLQPSAIIFVREENGSSFCIGADNGSPFVEVNGQRSAAGAPLTVNSWRHLAVVATGGQITLYLDGESYASLAAPLPALNAAAQLGSDGTDGSTGFVGELDELQIAKTARPVGFIKFGAFSQGGEKSAHLLVFGPDEQASNGLSWLEGGYFGVIIKNLTFDGWLVIGVLAIMLVVSWAVMIGKFRYLNRIAKGNSIFAREWHRLASDLTLLDQADGAGAIGGQATSAEREALKKSPIYRIYHIGAEAIRHRLALRPDQPKSLSSRAIQAIRANLDGGLVRETFKLNSKIVLLTIAISGGPFLGLLGTVVGVMITFAAVAAAGEVNVNAIAPGIAAALLATVAGLAVAIPSLFGYNYLLSRIKETISEMHVFIDEFVTQMAEHYRGGPAE